MSYTKQVWNTGEKITADKLNHMEDGIENCCGGGTPTLTLNLGTASGSYYITEEDANKVFGDYPIGFKFRTVANGEANPLIKAFTLDSFNEDGGHYVASVDGQNVTFQFENVIVLGYTQGDDLILAWNSTSRRYEKDTGK